MGKSFGASPSSSSSSSTSDVANNQTFSNEFEILSTPTSPSSGMINPTNSHFEELRLCVNSANFDLSPDEIQSRLREILRENLELKETLHENNTAMSEQFDRLSQWQKEVKKVQDYNKQKYEESKQIIEKLINENLDLKKQLESVEVNATDNAQLRKTLKDYEETIQTLRNENEKNSVINLQLAEEIKNSKDVQERIKVSRNHLLVEKQDLLATNNDLQSRLESVQKQLSNLQMSTSSLSDKEEQSLVIVQPPTKKTEESSMVGIRELLLQLRVEQEKSSALITELMEERKSKSLLILELNSLKQNLTATPSVKATTPIVTELQQKGTEILTSIRENEMKLTETNRGQKEKALELEDRLTECHDRLQSMRFKDESLVNELKMEIEELRQILAQEQSANREDKMNLNAANQQFENLLQDYQKLLNSWETYEHEQAKKGVQSVAYYEIQIKSLREQIDRLTAQLVVNEESGSQVIDENNQLRKQNRLLMQELEKMPILEAQVEVYQTDFRMEREAREKALEEKERAVREITRLESRLKQLSEEIELDRRARLRQMRETTTTGNTYNLDLPPDTPRQRSEVNFATLTPTGGAIRKQTTRTAPLNTSPYVCPRCNLGFTEFQPLENHVNHCLDRDDPFL